MNIFRKVALLALCCFALTACATTKPTRSQVDEQRATVTEVSQESLDSLYQQYPEAKESIARAAGYAVFSNFGFKFLFMGGANGHGVAVNNADKKVTYMKMMELQPGLGFGVQKFRVIFIFATPRALNDFITSGWEFGANAMAAVKSSTQGGGSQLGANVAQDVTMYQLSDKGAIVGVSLTAAKYYRNDELN